MSPSRPRPVDMPSSPFPSRALQCQTRRKLRAGSSRPTCLCISPLCVQLARKLQPTENEATGSDLQPPIPPSSRHAIFFPGHTVKGAASSAGIGQIFDIPNLLVTIGVPAALSRANWVLTCLHQADGAETAAGVGPLDPSAHLVVCGTYLIISPASFASL